MAWSFDKLENISQEQFSLWENLLEKRTGIQLTESRQTLLRTQIAIRMRELGKDNHSDYFNLVGSDINGPAEWQILVDRLMVREAAFFRNRPALELVRQYVQNYLISRNSEWNTHSRKQVGNHKQESLELWSVGCYTGEESYTLAAIVSECYARQGINPYFGVTASDISLPALSIARVGEYGRCSLDLLTDEERQRYFQPCGKDRYRINDSIRQRVCFSQLNLLELKNKPRQPMDIIYCQNVLVYFRRWRRKEILRQLVSHLKRGGMLIVGPGEVTDWKHEQMERVVHDEVQAYVKRR